MKVVRTDNAPAAIGPYSQGIVVNGMLFASGQIALDPASGEMVGTTIQEQTEQVMKNVTGLLEAAGTDLNHVVKTSCSWTISTISWRSMRCMRAISTRICRHAVR